MIEHATIDGLEQRGLVISSRCPGLYRDSEDQVQQCGRAAGHPAEFCGPVDLVPAHQFLAEFTPAPRTSFAAAMLAALGRYPRVYPHVAAVALGLAVRYDATGEPVDPAELTGTVGLADQTIRRWLRMLVEHDLASRTRDRRFIPTPPRSNP